MPKKSKTSKLSTSTLRIGFDELIGLFGKPVKDEAVTALLARAGKVKVSTDYAVAKEAGFDLGFSLPPYGKKKVVTTVFLFASGADGHAGFASLPKGFSFGTRDELPKPSGDDEWTVKGHTLHGSFSDDGTARHFSVSMPTEALGGEALHANPLHFESRPPDAPEYAPRLGVACLLVWALRRFSPPPKHHAIAAKLATRAISPVTFLREAFGDQPTSLDVPAEAWPFVRGYTNRTFTDSDARGAAANKTIAKLLALPEPDRRFFHDDYLGTFSSLESPFYVPDDWTAVDRLSPVLDARFDDFVATGLSAPPTLTLYETAAKARDAHPVRPARATVGTSLDADFADALIALVGRSLKDAEVKATLARASLPVAKNSVQHANPALGVAYSAGRRDKVLVIESVDFYTKGYTKYVTGLGSETSFFAYPGPLPNGLRFGMTRAEVTKQLGAPTSQSPTYLFWKEKTRSGCEFADKVGLVHVFVALPPA